MSLNASQYLATTLFNLLETKQTIFKMMLVLLQFVMHVDFLSEEELVIVERPPSAITDELPLAFKVKKFGT